MMNISKINFNLSIIGKLAIKLGIQTVKELAKHRLILSRNSNGTDKSAGKISFISYLYVLCFYQ